MNPVIRWDCDNKTKALFSQFSYSTFKRHIFISLSTRLGNKVHNLLNICSCRITGSDHNTQSIEIINNPNLCNSKERQSVYNSRDVRISSTSGEAKKLSLQTLESDHYLEKAKKLYLEILEFYHRLERQRRSLEMLEASYRAI